MKNLKITGLVVISLVLVLYGCGDGIGSGVSSKAGKGSISTSAASFKAAKIEETGNGGSGSGGGTPGNTTATALNIAPTSSYSGTLPAEPDFHAFSIDIPSAGAVTAYTTGSTDTMGGLYDQNINNLVWDDNSGTGNNFSFCVAINAGLYYLGVFPFTGTTGGPYTLNVDFVSGGSCSGGGGSGGGGEGGGGSGGGTPGNTTATALNIAPTSSYSGTLPADPDFHAFSINIPSTGALTAYTTGSTDTLGGLWDHNVNPLTWDDDSGPGVNFLFCIEINPGLYYLGVFPFARTAGGPYTLNVDFVSGGTCPVSGGGEGGSSSSSSSGGEGGSSSSSSSGGEGGSSSSSSSGGG